MRRLQNPGEKKNNHSRSLAETDPSLESMSRVGEEGGAAGAIHRSPLVR
jgi:hypothetical protein